ncbi:dynein heavy chain 1, axonemal, partial [Kipferlia bialata]
DRIYMTLTGAIHMNLGGSPAGPAGTGKTETVKDLGKALAMAVIVFNCSEGLDYLAMAKFFTGLAMTGAWSCFDEFNRIDIEVLSVIAQQIMTIQRAVRMKIDRFVFEGIEITIKPTCAVFITMNPGYAGRTELPDNLKACFRPVACMIPDYALIAEIRLFSFGFVNARELAQKTTAAFRLSSEQLSAQDHYDFGMRALNTTLVAAGNRKQATPEGDEYKILLKALKDVNLPKFLENDIILFDSIVCDLFPSITVEEEDKGAMDVAIREACAELNLQPTPMFIKKCFELYDTITLRHGLMMVGPTVGGKTMSVFVLQKALASMAQQEKARRVEQGVDESEDWVYKKVLLTRLNPKAITMGQLYGQFDPVSHEWTDGILASIIRKAVSNQRPEYRWTVFDGPVDALWIENMNTVLDDNKKLCLTSGEIIALTPGMNMIFEVQDLAEASPATVSRCGMVYYEPALTVSIDALCKSYTNDLAPALRYSDAEFTVDSDLYTSLTFIMSQLLVPGVAFIREHCKETMATVDANLAMSFFRLLDSFLADYQPNQTTGRVGPEQRASLSLCLEPIIVFCLVWGMGGSVDGSSRARFSQWLQAKLKETGIMRKKPFPIASDGDLVYDYHLKTEMADPADHLHRDGSQPDPEELVEHSVCEWIPWLDSKPPFVVPEGIHPSSITVPTLDTLRSEYVLAKLTENGHSVACVGPTGTSKSVVVQEYLLNGCDSHVYQPIILNFSAQTSANKTQDFIDEKMDKRRKGVYGPPAGRQFVVFVDDTNMPAKEVYGAQPPIELLRQLLDHGGWYDRKTLNFRTIVDTTLCTAMGPPGGGRNSISDRFLRFFNFLSFPEMADSSLRTIFGTIVDWWLAQQPSQSALGQTGGIGQSLVDATINVFNTIRTELLPTPAKSHYTFNLRDLAKVFQGILSVGKGVSDSVPGLQRLWIHECQRVFADRFVCAEDTVWFKDLLNTQLEDHFHTTYDKALVRGEGLGEGLEDIVLFGDYVDIDTQPKPYTEVQTLTSLKPSSGPPPFAQQPICVTILLMYPSSPPAIQRPITRYVLSRHVRQMLRRYGILGALDGVHTLLQSVGLNYLPGSVYTLVKSSTLVFNLCLSRIIIGKRFTAHNVVSVVVVSSGIALMGLQPDEAPDPVVPGIYTVALICTVGAAFVNALQTVLAEVLMATDSEGGHHQSRTKAQAVSEASFYNGFISFAVVLPVGLVLGLHESWSGLPTMYWVASWGVALVKQLGYICKFQVCQLVSALFAGIIDMLRRVVVILTCLVVFNEELTWQKLCSVTIVCLGFGVYMHGVAQTSKKKRVHVL